MTSPCGGGRPLSTPADVDGAWVEFEPSEGGPGERVIASYVVGCDGANSTIRDVLGVEFEDRGFFFDWLVVDVQLQEPRVFDPPNLQVCDPAAPHHRRLGWAGSASLGVHVPPGGIARRPGRRGECLGLPRALGCPARQRRAGAPCRLPLPGPLGHPVARGPGLPRRRCRPPDATVRRPGDVRRPARRGQPGLEARLCAGSRKTQHCSRPTTSSGSHRQLPSSRLRPSSVGSLPPVRRRPAPLTRRWRRWSHPAGGRRRRPCPGCRAGCLPARRSRGSSSSSPGPVRRRGGSA